MQRSITRSLAGDEASISKKLADLQRLSELNGLDGTTTTQPMQALGQAIEQLSDGILPAAQAAAEAARQSVRAGFDEQGSADASMAALARQSTAAQQQSLDALDSLVAGADRNGALQDIQRNFDRLLREQGELAEQTRGLQMDNLNNKNSENFTNRKQMLGSQQLELAQQLDQLLVRVQEFADEEVDEHSPC